MARASWLGDDSHPDLDAHIGQLEHFTQSMADGVIDEKELEQQGKNLAEAMKAVESSLSDEQHAKVTRLLAEVAAYSVMQTMQALAAARVAKVVAPKQ